MKGEFGPPRLGMPPPTGLALELELLGPQNMWSRFLCMSTQVYTDTHTTEEGTMGHVVREGVDLWVVKNGKEERQ